MGAGRCVLLGIFPAFKDIVMKLLRVPIGFSAFNQQPTSDIVGIELGAGLAQGVPAVRMCRQNGVIEILAMDFLPLQDTLPQSPEGVSDVKEVWHLPKAFCAPHAALTITSELTFLRHSSGTTDEIPEKKRFPYRHISRVLAQDVPVLIAGVPEFQAQWAAGLFPEGHPPTACSLQISPLAAMNGLLHHPSIRNLDGCCIAMLVFARHTALVAFQNRIPVLYREHPLGVMQVQQEVAEKMQLDPVLIQQLLNDASVDSSSFFEPILRPLYRQVEILSDYLARRRNAPASRFFITGPLVGERYWISLFGQMMGQELTVCPPLAGIPLARNGAVTPENLQDVQPLFACAAGAALAVLEAL